MSNNNRKAVTVRMNLQDQNNLRALVEFWGLPEAKIVKLAFEQLVAATDQMQKKLREKEKENVETNATGSNDSVSDYSTRNAAAEILAPAAIEVGPTVSLDNDGTWKPATDQ